MPLQTSPYQHRQFGAGTIFTALCIAVTSIVFTIVLLRRNGASPAFWLVSAVTVAIIIAVLTVFSRLETSVSDGAVRWAFGYGFPRYSLSLAEVRSVRTVDIGWWMGTGIRIVPGGMLYNVGGGRAVEMTLADRRILLGSDEPDALAAAIDQARSAR